jgi:hypothetical protein
MTPEAQRIAIAEALGLEVLHAAGTAKAMVREQLCTGATSTDWRMMPDYLNDLNAALTLIDFLAEYGWRCNLANGLDQTWECEFMREPSDNTPYELIGVHQGETFEIHYAPADTMPLAICQAFLRTLGKWQPAPLPPKADDPAHLGNAGF